MLMSANIVFCLLARIAKSGYQQVFGVADTGAG
jgi:hypothetical protein